MIEKCYEMAIRVLKKNSTKLGFKASFNYYNQIWARDGAICIIASLLTNDEELIECSKRTLITLAKFQSAFGQIPNAIFLKDRKVSYYATDSTLWWIISFIFYVKYLKDEKFFSQFKDNIVKAFNWSRFQVIDSSLLINSPPSGDWMDSAIGRVGKVLYNNCLYFKACEYASEFLDIDIELEKIKENINLIFWPKEEGKELLPPTWNTKFYEEAINKERSHYLSSLSFETYDSRFDTLGNCLSILFEIADKEKTKKIMEYINRKNLSSPYPIKVLNPPIFYPNPTWNPKIDLYRSNEQRCIPFQYHNSAIWPWVGGMYILTLGKLGMKKKIKEELKKLAEANYLGKKEKWEFNEWLHGKTGKPEGAIFQSWSAAGFIIAYFSGKKNLYKIL